MTGLVEDRFDYPELPLWQRLWLAVTDDDPDVLYGVGEGDGAYDTINGLLGQEYCRYDVAVANAMGLTGDWGVDDVTEAVSDAFQEYRGLRSRVSELERELERLHAANLEMCRRRTLGGLPPEFTTVWTNRRLPIVEGGAL